MRRLQARDTAVLAVGSTVSGLLAYVFFSLVTRTLGATAAAGVSVLWTYWAAAAAVLTFPLQHWVARTVAAEDAEDDVRAALPGTVRVIALVALVAGGVAWGARNALFDRPDALFPLLVAAVTLGSGFVGLVRGVLTARRRFGAVALALVGENGVRCVVAAGLAAGGVRAPAAYGAALALGPLIGLLWPSALRLERSDVTPKPASALTFLGGVAGGSLLGQFVLTGGPIVLALTGGRPADVTALFAGLALFRAPYTMALGVVAQLTGWLTSLVVGGHDRRLARLRLRLIGAIVAGVVGAAAFGYVVGPAAVRAVFGADVMLRGAATAVLAAGSTIALANLVTTLTLIARGRGGGVLRAWVAGTAAGAVVMTLGPMAALDRVVWAFAVAELMALVVMLVEDVRGAHSAGAQPPQVTPTSPPVT